MKGQSSFLFTACILLLSGGLQSEKQMNKAEVDTSKQMQVVDTRRTLAPASEEYVFKGDSITVTLTKDSSDLQKILFAVNVKGKNFNGVANLELIEDNGKFYLPESTPRLDEKTNGEYVCDSTFSYQSGIINFVFAMENKTQKRLSFIINNSLVNGVEDSFNTLYRAKQ